MWFHRRSQAAKNREAQPSPDSTFLTGQELVQDGQLTDKGVAEHRLRLPHADLSILQSDRRPSAIPDLLTVGLVAAYVAWKSNSRVSEGMVAERP
jgi:hypothetical protein